MASKHGRVRIMQMVLFVAAFFAALLACVLLGFSPRERTSAAAADEAGIQVTNFDSASAGTIYSYTQPANLKRHVTVQFTDAEGAVRELESGEFIIAGSFAPTQSGTNGTFEKTLTIEYTDSDSQQTYTTEYTFTVQTATPLNVVLAKINQSAVEAYSVFDPNDYIVTVNYSGGSATLDAGAYKVIYGDADGVQDEDATGYIYDEGMGTVFVRYSENGSSSIISQMYTVDVSKVSIAPVDFSNGNTSEFDYSYDEESGQVTAEAQYVSLSSGYNSSIMTIAQVMYDNGDGETDVTAEVTAQDTNSENTTGTLTLTNVGEYTVTVRLTNLAYFWRGMKESVTDITLTYTITKAPLDLSATFTLNGDPMGDPVHWEVDTAGISIAVSGNYGGGTVIYYFTGDSHDGVVTDYPTSDPTNVPNHAGDKYKMYIEVGETANFLGGQSQPVAFTVGQRVISAPTVPDLVYNGKEQTPTISYAAEGDDAYLYVQITKGTNVGTYTVTFTIDQNNAKWAGDASDSGTISDDEKTLKIEYDITRLAIKKPALDSATLTYNNEESQSVALTPFNQTSTGGSFDAIDNAAITIAYNGGNSDKVGAITVDEKGTFSVIYAGTYTVTIYLNDTANLMWEGSSDESPDTGEVELTLTVDKAKVDVPDGQEKPYDGTSQTGDFSSGLYTAAQGSDWTNAQVYTVTLTLTDPANYRWENDETGTSDTATTTFTITQAPNAFTEQPSIVGWTYGDEARVPSGAEANFGDIVYMYASSAGSGYSEKVPTAAGTYYVKAFVSETANWKAAESKAVSFTIARREITITWSEEQLTYNGEEQAPTATAGNTVSGDVLTLTVTVKGEHKNAGTYTAQVTAIGGTGAANYAIPAANTKEFTIARQGVARPTEDTTPCVYDGSEKTYSPVGFDESTMNISENRVQTNAGTYSVIVSLKDKTNYEWKNESGALDGQEDIPFTFTIARKAIARPVVSGTYTYNGRQQDSNVVSCEQYTVEGNGETNAGEYTLTVTPTENYCWKDLEGDAAEDSITLTWTIARLEVAAPAIKREMEYQNGSDLKPELSGTITVSDVTGEIKYTYEYSNENSSAHGTYSVTLTFSDSVNFLWISNEGNKNDNVPEDEFSDDKQSITLYYNITKSLYELEYSLKDWTYGNDPNKPSFTGEMPSEVEGAIDSGKIQITYTYVAADGTTYRNASKLPAGNYTLSVHIPETDSCEERTFTTSFSVLQRTITVTITVSDGVYGSWKKATFTFWGNTELEGYETIAKEDISLVYTGSLTEGLPRNQGSYSVSAELLNKQNNFKLSIKYAGGSSDGSFTISPLTLEVSEESGWSGNSFEYSGKRSSRQPVVTGANVVFSDDIESLALTYTVMAVTGSLTDGKAVNVGTYKVTIQSIGNTNYQLPADDISYEFTVTAKAVTLSVSVAEGKGVYGAFNGKGSLSITPDGLCDGDDLSLVVTFQNTSGAGYIGSVYHAGGYTATIALGNDNYVLAAGENVTDGKQTYKFTVEKCPVKVDWKETPFSYNNTNHNYDTLNLATFAGVGAEDGQDAIALDVSLTQGDFISAGTYTLQASLPVAYRNDYTLTGTEKAYTISPAEITIKLKDQTATYDGTTNFTIAAEQGVTYDVEGNTFGVEIDGYITFTIQSLGKDVASYDVAGEWSGNNNFSVTFGGGSAVFEDAFKITRRTITVTFNSYDGGAYGAVKETTWTADGLADGEDKSVLGGKVSYLGTGYDGSAWSGESSSAGKYTLSITIANDNYCFADGTKTYTEASANFEVSRSVIKTITWATRTFTYNGNSFDDDNFATATGVNDDGTLYLTETITALGGGDPIAFINAGDYLFTASLTDEQAHNYVLAENAEKTHEYTIDIAEIIISGVEGYEGTYDGSAHNVRDAGDAQTQGGMTATWEYSLNGIDEWSESLTLKDACESTTVHYRVTADNHDTAGGTFTVTIAKRDISIAFDAVITYGDALPAVDSGLYEERRTGGSYATGESFGCLGITIEKITAEDYKAGSPVDNYVLSWSYSGTSGNYNVTPGAGTLTVSPLALTIDIDNLTSKYSTIDKSAVQSSWSYVGDAKILFDDDVFTITTTATNSSSVGDYFLYAVLGKDAGNYAVTFTGDTTYDGAAYEGKKAGIHKIEPLPIEVTTKSPSGEYDGTAKKWEAKVGSGGPEGVLITPEYYLSDGVTKLDDAPVDVGTYYVEFSSSDPNYTSAKMRTEFTITARDITVTITASGGEYNGAAYSASVSFNDVAARDQEAFERGDAYTITYSGKLCNGTAYESTTIAPVNAGSYTATVTLNSGEGTENFLNNYEITNTADEEFEISQRTLTVKVGNASVVYGDDIGENTFSVSYKGFFPGEEGVDGALGGDLSGTLSYTTSNKSGGAAYKAGDGVENSYTVEANGLVSNNYAIDYADGTLSVTPRPITVNIKDQTHDYTSMEVALSQGEEAAYTVAEGTPKFGEDDLDITVSAVDATNAGTYPISAKCGNENYSVTFKGFYAGGEKGTLTIRKLTLTIKANDISVQYGTDLGEIGFSVAYDGFVPGEGPSVLNGELVYTTAGEGSSAYAAGAAAGSAYTIKISGVSADNYDIEPQSGTLTVIPREVWGGDDGKVPDGTYSDGSPVPATVTFQNAYNNEQVKYNIVYSGTSNSGQSYTENSTAPGEAGSYTIKVTITDPNYCFAGGSGEGKKSFEFDYTVNKRTLNVSWETQSFSFSTDQDEYINTLLGFDESRMTIVSWTEGAEMSQSGDAVKLTVTGRGSYFIVIQLTNDAFNNYQFGDEAQSATRYFTVSASENSLTITVAQGWTYGDDPILPEFELANGNPEDVVYSYAKYVEDGEPADASYTTIVPSGAGKYWVRVRYNGNSDFGMAVGYAVFEIEKCTLTVPTLASESATYTGEQLSVVLSNFNGNTMGIINTDNVLILESEGGVITLNATNAGTYSVTLTLRDTANYVWEGVSPDLTLTWTIAPAKDNAISEFHFSEPYTYGETLAAPSATAKYGTVNFAYAVYDESKGEDYGQLTGWTREAPKNAGTYVICAYVRDADHNYNDAYAYIKFTIGKAKLTVYIGFAGVTYGEAAPDSFQILSYAGFVNGDGVSSLGGQLTFSHGYTPGSDVGSYPVTASGYTSDNYSILYEAGTLYVTRAAVTVVIGDQQSAYGEEIVLDQSQFEASGLVAGDKEDVLGVVLSKAEGENAGTYAITGTASATNYTVTFENGTYTVTQAENAFTEDPTIQGWIYGGSANSPQGGQAKFGTETIVYMYASSEDGDYETSVPTNAGIYYVKAFVSATNNYAAAESAAVSFTIGKAVLTAPVLADGETVFSGSEQTNTLTGFDNVTMAFSAGISVSVDGSSITLMATDAGAYAITISLKDSGNYAWEEEGASITLTWTIAPAEDNEISEFDFSASFAYGETPAAPSASAKYGTAVYSYAVYDADVGDDFGQLTGWTEEMPKNAGVYVVRAYVSDESGNYNEAYSYIRFTIEKATLTVVIGSDSVMYGEEAPETFGVSYTGFVNGDGASVLGGQLTFSHGYSVGSDAGGYTVTASGYTSEDYVIEYAAGTLTVTPAPAIVAIGDQWSTYGEEIALDQSQFVASGLVAGDEESDLGITLVKAEGDDAGTYIISGASSNGNYTITFINGIYTITPRGITVEITAGGGVYGGTIMPAAASLSGVAEGDEVSVALTYTGTSNSGVSVSGTEVPALAGSYIVTASVADGNYTLTGNASAAFVVDRMTVEKPSAAGKTYTGAALVSGISETDRYTVSEPENMVDAGGYTVVLTLKDAANTRWAETDGAAVSVTFTIAQAQNAFTAQPSLAGWSYGGQANAPTGALALFGTESIVYMYASSEDGAYTTAVPSSAGTYWVRAYVRATGNYTAAQSEAVSFTIAKAVLAAPSLENASATYSGSEQTNTLTGFDNVSMAFSADISVSVNGSEITLKATNAGSYTVTISLKDASNYAWAGGGTSVTLTWTIEKRLVEKPSASAEEYTANGGEIVYLPVGFDAAIMEMTGGAATEAGEYTVTVSLKDTANYAWSDGSSDPVSFTWTIGEEEISLTWLVITLSCVAGAEVVILAIGIARRRKMQPEGGAPSDGGDLPPEGDGSPDGEGTPDGEEPETAEEPAAEEPAAAEEPVAEEPAAEEPEVTEESAAEEPAAAEESASEEPAAAEESAQPEDGAGNGGAQSGKLYSFAAGAPLLAVLASAGEGIASGVLGAVVVGLFIAILVVFLKKKKAKSQENAEPAAEEPVQTEVAEEPVAEEPEQTEPVAEEPEQPAEIPAEPEEIPVAACEEPVEEPVAEPEEESAPVEEPIEEPAEEPEDAPVPAEEPAPAGEPEEEDAEEGVGEIAVAQVPEEWKAGIGLAAFGSDKIYFRYNYSFYAKLVQASAEMQQRYGELCDEIDAYPRMKTTVSWKRMRVYSGRKTLAMLLFKGKKLCIAFALDPKQYAETKYRGEDMSDKRKYEKTPMLLRLSSPRKLRYAKHLLSEVAAAFGLEKGEVQHSVFGLPYRSTDDLIRDGLIKVLASDRRDARGGTVVRADVAAMIRQKISFVEAHAVLSDEDAQSLIEDATAEPVAAPAGLSADEAPSAAEPAPRPAGKLLRDVPKSRRGTVNIDTLSRVFGAGEVVSLEALKAKKILPKKIAAYKVLARGVIDKPLIVEAQDFSLDAVKMITLTGGKARKVRAGD